MPRVVPVTLALLLAAAAAPAQDAHYWDNQYGTKGQLLGGLVVGAPSDLSASFYNPAWLALRTDASLLLTTQALEYSDMEIRNAEGTGTSPNYSQFRPSPGFLGGRFKAGGEEGWSVTWSYLEKMRFSYDATARLLYDDPDPPPFAIDWFTGEAFRKLEVNDLWYGASFARHVGDRVAIGVTPYLAYRSQNQRAQAEGRVSAVTGDFGELYFVDEFKYWHFRALAKVGVAFDTRPVSWGLAVTTPSVGIMGSGEYYANRSSSGLDIDGDAIPDIAAAASEQKELDARWRSPLSVAVGASWQLGETRLHATAEWFDAVPGYDVVSAEAFAAQSGAGVVTPSLRVHLRSLVNWGIAVDHRFSPKFSLYGGFRADLSAQGERPDSNVLLSSWNLWHASAGASFQFLGIELATGLEYSFGNGRTYRGYDFTRDLDPESVAAYYEAEVDYRRLKLLVGFDLALLTGGADTP